MGPNVWQRRQRCAAAAAAAAAVAAAAAAAEASLLPFCLPSVEGPKARK